MKQTNNQKAGRAQQQSVPIKAHHLPPSKQRKDCLQTGGPCGRNGRCAFATSPIAKPGGAAPPPATQRRPPQPKPAQSANIPPAAAR